MFFNKKIADKDESSYFVKIGALLIHAAKIDENYSNDEEEIIKKTLLELGANKNELNTLMINAKKNEEKANQILDFTREIKNMSENDKIKIVKSLWRIIYSNKDADMYETNLMRRLSGLLYIDSKTMGYIKEQIKKENL
ncbi:MAG: Tellurite resistance protein TerB [Pelagibacteraceae bacterium TMED201]|jgi:Uncharacterized protein conserved in bacteria|nr:MAG: Tellurite resistance protein TerB [Pelagibacteraceae bacterium TMED201]|tara:strand:- start:305 stop:721 length:417 start_codon:yes stop_codon:yes gene_type:complete